MFGILLWLDSSSLPESILGVSVDNPEIGSQRSYLDLSCHNSFIAFSRVIESGTDMRDFAPRSELEEIRDCSTRMSSRSSLIAGREYLLQLSKSNAARICIWQRVHGKNGIVFQRKQKSPQGKPN